MKNLLRPRVVVADRPTVPARFAALLAVLLVALAGIAASPAHAANGERVGNGSLPQTKAVSDSLTYDSFSSFNCSQTGFFANAVAHMDISGHVFIDGQTYLNGVPYDTYFEDLLFGPDTFPTDFSRNFTPPPPANSTYTFVFRSRVRQDDRQVGVSTTTITCANGAFSAVNDWESAAAAVPAGDPATWAALGALLAAAAALRLRARRA